MKLNLGLAYGHQYHQESDRAVANIPICVGAERNHRSPVSHKSVTSQV